MAGSETPKIGLNVPDYQDTRWDVPVNENWNRIDDVHGTVVGNNVDYLPGITIPPVAHFVYNSAKDSDDGLWRKEALNQSWYHQSGEMPAIVLVVAEPTLLTLFDGTDPTLPVWMEFQGSASNMLPAVSGDPIRSLHMLNGVLCVGLEFGGLAVINFIQDGQRHVSTASNPSYNGNIAQRNDGSGYTADVGDIYLPNGSINTIAMLKQVDDISNPIIGIGTDVGASVINGPAGRGTLVTSAFVSSTYSMTFRDDKSLWYSDGTGNTTYIADDYSYDSFPATDTYSDTTVPMFGDGTKKLIAGGGGSYDGLWLLKPNDGAIVGMVNHINYQMQTGWMFGDCRLSTMNSVQEGGIGGAGSLQDYSSNEVNLDINGSLTKSVLQAGAPIAFFGNFSSTNYIEQAYTAGLDFGTDDFSIMFWCNTTSGSLGCIFERGSGANRLYGRLQDDNTIRVICGAIDVDSAAFSPGLNFVVIGRLDGMLYIHVDGDSKLTPVDAPADLTVVDGITIGINSGLNDFFPGSLALFRMSRNCPTAEEAFTIYAEETAIMTTGNSATILTNDVDVQTLTEDPVTGTIYVGTYEGMTEFNGLASKLSTAVEQDGSVATSAVGGYVLDDWTIFAPAINIREQVNLVNADSLSSPSPYLPIGWLHGKAGSFDLQNDETRYPIVDWEGGDSVEMAVDPVTGEITTSLHGVYVVGLTFTCTFTADGKDSRTINMVLVDDVDGEITSFAWPVPVDSNMITGSVNGTFRVETAHTIRLEVYITGDDDLQDVTFSNINFSVRGYYIEYED